ncbi:hypothetical protein Cabys_555 [Caldithrix abyssi DSM 13497]|uniref:Uncharacterized protein n=1 Tax=Caldithrix abyssi DSM 13497 TaxID=880073 RepID=A0A1J1C5M1_CALAY|nr:hypothetical protein Cabys_555 [Caldithrix abyssi DSM 13497]
MVKKCTKAPDKKRDHKERYLHDLCKVKRFLFYENFRKFPQKI